MFYDNDSYNFTDQEFLVVRYWETDGKTEVIGTIFTDDKNVPMPLNHGNPVTPVRVLTHQQTLEHSHKAPVSRMEHVLKCAVELIGEDPTDSHPNYCYLIYSMAGTWAQKYPLKEIS